MTRTQPSRKTAGLVTLRVSRVNAAAAFRFLDQTSLNTAGLITLPESRVNASAEFRFLEGPSRTTAGLTILRELTNSISILSVTNRGGAWGQLRSSPEYFTWSLTQVRGNRGHERFPKLLQLPLADAVDAGELFFIRGIVSRHLTQ